MPTSSPLRCASRSTGSATPITRDDLHAAVLTGVRAALFMERVDREREASGCSLGAAVVAASRRRASVAVPPKESIALVPVRVTDLTLDAEGAAALKLVSRPTIYRLLKLYPATLMLGHRKQSARWPNRAAFEAWLAEALAKRRADRRAPHGQPARATAGSSRTVGDGPLSTWLQVARALGVDDSTIRAHRRRTRDGTRSFFGTAMEARAWYAALVAAPDYVAGKAPRRSRARAASENTGPVDWSKVKV